MNRFVTMAILSLLAASICGQEPVPGKPDLASRPFMRLLETKDGGFLQVLVATYKRGDATATLFGCVHVADRQFYEGMQKRF